MKDIKRTVHHALWNVGALVSLIASISMRVFGDVQNSLWWLVMFAVFLILDRTEAPKFDEDEE